MKKFNLLFALLLLSCNWSFAQQAKYVFYFIALLYALRLIKKKIIQRVVYAVVLCFAIFKLYTTITADYRYIPYTNYFTYTLIHGEKGIIYREDYNYRYSPYTD